MTIDDSRIGEGAASCQLVESGPVVATSQGQLIERLRITAHGSAGITVGGLSDVVIQDCEILHDGAHGIDFSSAPGLTIRRTRVVHTGAPDSGPNPSSGLNNIQGYDSSDVTIESVRLDRGSSGIYLLESPRARMRFIEGHDFRGPLPRGQLVQLDDSDDASLEDFWCDNPAATSWPEDNVSVYVSSNVTVRRGLITGNNAPTGAGVKFDSAIGGLCEDVDTFDMGNGSFSSEEASGVAFVRTRARENHCEGQAGREPPASGGLVWGASPGSSEIRIEASRYYDLCNPDNLVWDTDVVVPPVDLVEEDFALRAPTVVDFCWE